MMSSRIQAKERDVDEMYSTTADKMNDEVDPGLLNINLENFEEPGFEDSKYVLTSPRSLAACTALGIKPMELLYKPLVEYQEELLPQGFPLRVCYEVFDQQEKERLNKLALCREERFRLISDEESNGEESPKWMPHAVRKSPKVPRKNVKIQDDGDAGMLLVANGDKPANKASLERQRTAWATSVGHHRVTRAEVKQRALEIFEAGQKLRDEALSGGTGTRRRPNKPGSARGRQGRARSADTGTRRQRPHSAGSAGAGRQ